MPITTRNTYVAVGGGRDTLTEREREREREVRERIKNTDKAKLEGVAAYTCTIFIIEFTITHL